MRSWLTKIGNSVYRVIGEGPNEGSLRYVGESKAPLKNDYGKDCSGLLLVIIYIQVMNIYKEYKIMFKIVK